MLDFLTHYTQLKEPSVELLYSLWILLPNTTIFSLAYSCRFLGGIFNSNTIKPNFPMMMLRFRVGHWLDR